MPSQKKTNQKNRVKRNENPLNGNLFPNGRFPLREVQVETLHGAYSSQF